MLAHNRANDPNRQKQAERDRRKKYIGVNDADTLLTALKR